jgi:histidinol phosphatase-like enzyme
MLHRAQNELQIDLSKSFVIGDKISDIQTGNNAGSTSILVLTGYGKNQVDLIREQNVTVEYIADDLYDAVQHIKNLVNRKSLSLS